MLSVNCLLEGRDHNSKRKAKDQRELAGGQPENNSNTPFRDKCQIPTEPQRGVVSMGGPRLAQHFSNIHPSDLNNTSYTSQVQRNVR